MNKPISDRIEKHIVRYEHKYVAPLHELHQIKSWLCNHPVGFIKSFPDRRINNIYLDTLSLLCFHDNLSGINERSKFRIRWYDSTKENVALNFEIKSKKNRLCSKFTYPLETVNWKESQSWRNFIDKNIKILPEHLCTILSDKLVPVVINNYTRSYFQTRCGSIRVTVDTAHTAYDQWTQIKPNFTMHAIVPDVIILEVKFSPEHADLGRWYARTIPYRYSRHSKYLVNAMNSLPL